MSKQDHRTVMQFWRVERCHSAKIHSWIGVVLCRKLAEDLGN